MVTEIVTFEINEATNEETFIEVVDRLELTFHMTLNGFIDCELAKGKDHKWTMVMHWQSIDTVKRASKLMMKEAVTEKFREALIPTSVKITVYEHVKRWDLSDN